MAVSVSGNKVTLVVDCEPQPPTFGHGPWFISTAGFTVMGTQDSREESFEVCNSVTGETEAEGGKLCPQPKLEVSRERKCPVST